MKKLLPLIPKLAAYTMFWGWNIFMATVLLLGLGPFILLDLVVAVLKGIVPWQFGAFAIVITLIPAAGSILALTTKLRADPGRLLSMFYGIQVPLMFLALTRLFAIHELVPSNALVLVVAVVGGAATLRTLLHGAEERSGALLATRIAAASAFATLGAWSAAVTALLMAPVFGYVVLSIPSWPGGLWDILWGVGDLDELVFLPIAAFFMLGLFLTLAMFLVMPFAFLGSTARTWQLVHRAGHRRWGRPAWALSVVPVAGLLALFAVLAQQPQAAVFSRIEAAQTDADRAAIVSDAATIRAGLMNARLGSDRYFNADPRGDGIHSHWAGVVGDTLAIGPQTVFQTFLAPFSYQAIEGGWARSSRSGARVSTDAGTATGLYADVFDSSMSRAEREALLRSTTYTWSWREVQAGLLSVGEQKVRLAAQEVTSTVEGDIATVRIHDVWRNQGFDREEILLAFDLPESAAITGLWMGPDPDVNEAFAYIVAPRGAAQEVYESEVRRRVDPALLESVGPRQYRLRAFPVEPRDSSRDSIYTFGDEGPDLHVWMEIVVPVVDGWVATPELTEARNAYWDGSEERTADGEQVEAEGWVPSIPAASSKRKPHQAIVSGFRVTATPDSASPAKLGVVDVVIDASASMQHHRTELTKALEQLRGPDVHVWCMREQVLVRCENFDAASALFWGHLSAGEHALRWSEQTDRRPDALIVLTDAGSYELAPDLVGGEVVLPPLWLVHLGGFPSAYPDWTLDRIQQTGGGIAASVPDLLAAMGDPSVVDGWRFTVVATEELPTAPTVFDAIAAKVAIRTLSMEQQGSSVDHLDRLHALAVEHHVVSPWSSMIVLVNQAQKDRLKKASEDDDRYEREGIDGERFEGVDVSAVPEPGTWLLLLVGGGLLASTRRRRAGHPLPAQPCRTAGHLSTPGSTD